MSITIEDWPLSHCDGKQKKPTYLYYVAMIKQKENVNTSLVRRIHNDLHPRGKRRTLVLSEYTEYNRVHRVQESTRSTIEYTEYKRVQEVRWKYTALNLFKMSVMCDKDSYILRLLYDSLENSFW